MIDQSTVSINPQDVPQVKETFAQTSQRCANPLVTMLMGMKLEGDFNKDIAVKQDEFKSVFKSYFGHTWLISTNTRSPFQIFDSAREVLSLSSTFNTKQPMLTV